jgi:hypothetical protein
MTSRHLHYTPSLLAGQGYKNNFECLILNFELGAKDIKTILNFEFLILN